ncbi:MAG: hypothetical protein IJZ29_03490 [Clostridia bacterium]|nr:hypothetical protein [Clostridia bacterium]
MSSQRNKKTRQIPSFYWSGRRVRSRVQLELYERLRARGEFGKGSKGGLHEYTRHNGASSPKRLWSSLKKM